MPCWMLFNCLQILYVNQLHVSIKIDIASFIIFTLKLANACIHVDGQHFFVQNF